MSQPADVDARIIAAMPPLDPRAASALSAKLVVDDVPPIDY